MFSLETDERLMRHALREAKKALDEDELPVGAVLVSADNKIVAMGHKQKGCSHRFDHAEILALRSAFPGYTADATGMTLYTTLEPCLQCFGAILNVRVSHIVFAMEDPYGGAPTFMKRAPEALSPRDQKNYPIVTSGVMRKESRALFAEYFKSTQNTFWRSASDNPFVRACLD